VLKAVRQKKTTQDVDGKLGTEEVGAAIARTVEEGTSSRRAD
jgi:hypothetical protein